MPLYEYQCTWCGKIFIAALPIETQQEQNVACPGCGDGRVEPLISPFTPKNGEQVSGNRPVA